PYPRNADAGGLGLAGARFPGDADAGQEIVAWRALLGEFLVPVRSVVADGRGADQRPWPGRGTPRADQGGHDLLGALHPAVEDAGLAFRVPALGEDVLAGQVDHRVAAGRGILPGPGAGRVAVDDRAAGPKALPGLLGPPSQNDNVVRACQQPAYEPASDKPGAAGDEDTHEASQVSVEVPRLGRACAGGTATGPARELPRTPNPSPPEYRGRGEPDKRTGTRRLVYARQTNMHLSLRRFAGRGCFSWNCAQPTAGTGQAGRRSAP